LQREVSFIGAAVAVRVCAITGAVVSLRLTGDGITDDISIVGTAQLAVTAAFAIADRAGDPEAEVFVCTAITVIV